ncbi:MAG: proline dehydrogenase family protein [Gracilimonas sp.]|uniref:proline dehydrogenase family protein n=1 Tax=Gracilimonas TaxID=649462 RepID=UPI001AFFED71|nr:proline dehydrogenase family protein [Gracilimonas sp.]MBO6584831.1 proline dehydrogenase family protein [Gracilimonas sp.]MBO6615898.1 proline dehydrogenase family protein [Gracilimonas sp.]
MKLPFILAKRFVAGESFTESIPKAKELNKKDLKLTLDLLGENIDDRQTATDTVDAYIRLLEGIKEQDLISSISIKLTMMGLDIDHDFTRENLFRLLDVAKAQDQFVRIDMEGSDHTQITLDIFKEAFERYGKHVGTVIQAMLHRSHNDIHELAEMGADIRLVKGAYSEPSKIALQNMPAIREAFKEQAKVLLEKTPFPRFGTHDDELIDWLKSYAAENEISKDRFEFQMLYGLREETMVQLSDEGYSARVYVPFGTDWFPYFKRRLMERKENVWFVLSTMFKK